MYTRLNGNYVGAINCTGGELVVMCELDRRSTAYILDNQLKIIGLSMSDHNTYDFIHLLIRDMSINQSYNDQLDVDYWFGTTKSHTCFINTSPRYVRRRNSWESCSPMYHNGTIWTVPKHDLDLFELPKFRHLITHCYVVLSLMLQLPELRTKILNLVIALLAPTDYCEYIDNSRWCC